MQLPLFSPGDRYNPIPPGPAYVPALLHRPGELQAVAIAGETTWAAMVPIFHLVGPAGRGNRPKGKGIASHLAKLRGAIGVRPHYLDVVRMSRGGTLEDVRQARDFLLQNNQPLINEEELNWYGMMAFSPSCEPAPAIPKPTCAECGKKDLVQTYTSQRDGREICLSCFENRKATGLAKETTRHPLDAWMGDEG